MKEQYMFKIIVNTQKLSIVILLIIRLIHREEQYMLKNMVNTQKLNIVILLIIRLIYQEEQLSLHKIQLTLIHHFVCFKII
jgi:hypothetical protein